MLYAIMASDKPNTLQQRLNARPDHLIRVKALMEQGRLFVAGAHPAIDSEDPGEAGFTGSLIIAEFASLKEAKAWISIDPYVTAGVYGDIVVKPFKKALP